MKFNFKTILRILLVLSCSSAWGMNTDGPSQKQSSLSCTTTNSCKRSYSTGYLCSSGGSNKCPK
jgi:hypothetical protein